MTTMYYATIRHHSIARARSIEAGATLAAAKRAATREFGSGFIEHEIVVYERYSDGEPRVAARRKIADTRWTMGPGL